MFNLRELREKSKINQNELASKIGISRQAVSLYENGQMKPTVANAKKIASILNFDWRLFYEEDNSQN